MSPFLRLFALLASAVLLLGATLADWPHPSAAGLSTSLDGMPTRPLPSHPLVDRGERLALIKCAHSHGDDEGRLVGWELTDVDPALGRIY